MLTAIREDGKRISLVDRWLLDELKEMRKEKQFYCPLCREKVLLKLGTKKQWHFAHHPHSSCSVTNETMYHLKGKKQLYETIKKAKIEVGLEVYLPIIQRRPDLLLRYNGNLYAIEYQCSSLDPIQLQKRINDYLEVGITPIWILGGNRLKRHFANRFSVKSFEWLCARKNIDGDYVLLYYCSDKRTFSVLSQLTPYSSTRLFATYEEYPLSSFSIDELIYLRKRKTLRNDQWLDVKKLWRTRPPTPYPNKTDLYMQQLLYRKQIPYNLFPIEAGWPSNYYYIIETAPHHWQSFLLLECIEYQPLHRPFSSQLIKTCFQPYVNERIFTLRSIYPFIHWSYAIDHYLHFLCHVRYVERVDHHHFKRVREITIPKTIEEAVELDRYYFYNNFRKEKSVKMIK